MYVHFLHSTAVLCPFCFNKNLIRETSNSTFHGASTMCTAGAVGCLKKGVSQRDSGNQKRQCPFLAPSVHGPQMVRECVCVSVCACMCVRACMCVWHIQISAHSVLCQCYTQAHAHMHPQTIWGQQTNGTKSGYCQTNALWYTVNICN